MIKFESGSHWYGRDGNPQHDADLRIARKAKLYPSVTTINKDTFKNDRLEKYKMEAIATAASETFKQPHESEKEYAQRIYEISLHKSKTASNFGTQVHDAIDKFPAPAKQEIQPWVDHFATWYNANVDSISSRERVLLDHDIGVAGRCDFIGYGKGATEGVRIIPDWKTQGVKVDEKGRKKPAFYDDWGRQLAFYAVCDAKELGTFPVLPVCISVIIDSSVPITDEVIYTKVYSKEEILDHYNDFVCGAFLWFSKRSYWPVGGWKPSFPFRMP